MTQQELADGLGVSIRTLAATEAGDRAMDDGELMALHAQGIDIKWLITGEGEMLSPLGLVSLASRSSLADLMPPGVGAAIQYSLGAPSSALGDALRYSESAPSSAVSAALSDVEKWQDFVLLPRYDIQASAGGGIAIHSEQIVDYLAFKANWIRDRLGRAIENLILIEANGDSMEPTISSGDLLLVDIGVTQLRDSAIYVLSLMGDLLVKRIERRLGGGVVVKSDNKNYDSETFNADQALELTIVGQVVWHGGML